MHRKAAPARNRKFVRKSNRNFAAGIRGTAKFDGISRAFERDRVSAAGFFSMPIVKSIGFWEQSFGTRQHGAGLHIYVK